MKEIKVIFSDKAFEVYSKLSVAKTKQDRMLLKSVDKKIKQLKHNSHLGNPINKNLIPLEYNANNLFRVELPCFWRLIYTLERDKCIIIAFVLDVVDHKEYNKIFGYKNK
jgi:hypothetical protein